MVLPPQRVAYWLALFADRLGRTFSGPTFAETARALDALQLTPPEFERAAMILYASQPFLPAPVEFLYAARPEARPEAIAARTLAALRAAREHWHNGVNQGTAIAWSKVPPELRADAQRVFLLVGGTADALEPGQDFGFVPRFESAMLAVARERVDAAVCLPPPDPQLRLASGG